MQTLKKRPKWVTGLRPKLEEALRGKKGAGVIVGKGALRGSDMIEILEVKFLEGKTGQPATKISENLVLFSYPVGDGEGADDVYYRLMGMLSRV